MLVTVRVWRIPFVGSPIQLFYGDVCLTIPPPEVNYFLRGGGGEGGNCMTPEEMAAKKTVISHLGLIVILQETN